MDYVNQNDDQVPGENQLKAHADKLLGELKNERFKRKDIEAKLSELQTSNDKYLNAYKDTVKQQFINDVFKQANINERGKCQVKAYILEQLEEAENQETGLPYFKTIGHENAESFASDLVKNSTYAECVELDVGGARNTITYTEVNKQSNSAYNKRDYLPLGIG